MAWVDPAPPTPDRARLRSGRARGIRSCAGRMAVLTASALAGLVEQTMTIAAGFAKTRYTLGVPISTLQAISHPLANMAIVVQGGRNLVPAGRLVPRQRTRRATRIGAVAFVFMAEEAPRPRPWRCTSRAASECRPKPPRPPTWCGRGLAAGRRRPRGQRQTDRPHPRRPRISQPNSLGDNGYGLFTSNCPTTTRPFCTRCATS
jgi:hypothetical protein